MTEKENFIKFIKKANQAHQQLSLWFYATNEFVKNQDRWNGGTRLVLRDNVRYKNFWNVVLPSLQYEWILASSRLFDPPYSVHDKKRERPRISLELILQNLRDVEFCESIRFELERFKPVLDSLKKNRNNTLAHNDASFKPVQIEAGIEDLFEWLEKTIERIKVHDPRLNNDSMINVEYNETLAKSAVKEIFRDLLIAEEIEKR